MELTPYEKMQLNKARTSRAPAPTPIREVKKKVNYFARRRATAVLIANHKEEHANIRKAESASLRKIIETLYEDGMTTEELLAKFYEAVK